MELQLLEQKIWILVSVIGVLWVIMLGIFGLATWALKAFIKSVLERLDTLIKATQELKNKDTGFQKDIESVNKTLEEHKEQINKIRDNQTKCKNFKPIGA